MSSPALAAISKAGMPCRHDQPREGPADGATLSEISRAMEAGEALSRRGSAAKPARRLPRLPSLSIPGALGSQACVALLGRRPEGPRLWPLDSMLCLPRCTWPEGQRPLLSGSCLLPQQTPAAQAAADAAAQR